MFGDRKKGRSALVIFLAVIAGSASGCKVMSREQVEAVRQTPGAGFDARRFVTENWHNRIMPTLQARAIDAAELSTLDHLSQNRLVHERGLRTSEGADWNVAVKGEGKVLSIDRSNPIGRLTLLTGGARVVLQTGPLVTGTAIRDTLPFIRFGDVPDQIAFAELGEELNSEALRASAHAFEALSPGDTVRFLGAATLSDNEALVLTPVSVNAGGPA